MNWPPAGEAMKLTKEQARMHLAEALADMCHAYGGKPLGLQAALALVVSAQAQHDRDQHAAWLAARQQPLPDDARTAPVVTSDTGALPGQPCRFCHGTGATL